MHTQQSRFKRKAILKISELAYGSQKARELFRDMIQQASAELGFEIDDTPLMVEAIPVSSDCLILIVTKVEDPEELDTRFSRFSKVNEYDIDDDDDLMTAMMYMIRILISTKKPMMTVKQWQHCCKDTDQRF